MRTVAHVTHEAIHKVGGIGAVLEGLLTSEPYRSRDLRTILIGPLFHRGGDAGGRLGPDGEVLYSSLDGLTRHPSADGLNHVRREYHVDLVYGHRSWLNPHTGVRAEAEVVLIDVSRMNLQKVNTFKAGLWHEFGIDSIRYEHSCEYDLYVKLAQPALAVLRALGAASHPGQCAVVAHEWMGVPTALATAFDRTDAFRTLFYAHETATIRPIVEHHPGHDVTFYNVLDEALSRGRYVDDVFGSQDHYYRHALVKAASRCDKILAVGDYVERELRFLGPGMVDADIEVTYNGIPAEAITLEEKKESREKLRDYAETLLGDRPDYVFSHVTRLVTSKGLWRDFRVLEKLEQTFRLLGKSAVMFVLSTELPPRLPEDVARMEAEWGWPLAHREKDADLSHGEAIFYAGVQQFNTRSRRIKIIFVNQFGWSPELCGSLMPPDMDLLDLRRGTDVEFGQSIYEPFGIAQLEPLTYGGICLMTQVCGSAGLVQRIAHGQHEPNVIVGDYCNCGPHRCSEAEWLSLSRRERHLHEAQVADGLAAKLLETLPDSDLAREQLIESGYRLARKLSWDVVARKFILPAIESVCEEWPKIRVA